MNSYDLADKYGMLSHDEINLLQYCVETLSPWSNTLAENDLIPEGMCRREIYNPIIVVNIGANIGTSSCAILETNPNAFVFSIDVKPWLEERQHIIDCGLNPARVIRLLGSSYEIGKHFPYNPDLVFVDGSHTDEAVIGDIECWKPKCKSIMLFHDFAHPNYKAKPSVHLDEIVSNAMSEWDVIGQARYLIAYRRLI